MKKLKGIVLVVILLLASIMMPFDVYAAVQSQIVPTFSSSTSQWNGHLYVTNFSDGTNNQASSTLSFTFDDDYYGIIYFDGYGPSNQHIANYAACFVAGGYGEYRYSYYQNGLINITSVTINIVNVVKPQTTVDLTQIITLLTAIENDTNSIDNVLDSTLDEIRDILSELIISNGYLETLTEMRQYNFPIESFNYLYQFFYLFNYDPIDLINYNYWTYPIYEVKNKEIARVYLSTSSSFNDYLFIFGLANQSISGSSQLSNIMSFSSETTDVSNISFNSFKRLYVGTFFSIYSIVIHYSSGSAGQTSIIANNNYGFSAFLPIYLNKADNKYLSTDFALQFGLKNDLLNNIELIANGTQQSNSAASDLESENSQMADDMDDLATIESGYNQQFNNQLQSIDFTSPIQSNAGILPAANFVISIFNGLINNNPFSVLIIVVCILLIGKKVIGK